MEQKQIQKVQQVLINLILLKKLPDLANLKSDVNKLDIDKMYQGV